MDKIKAKTHEYRMVMGDQKSRWSCCSEERAHEMLAHPSVGLAGCVYEVRELYTCEALDAVAHSAVLATFEAVRDSGNYPAGADMPDIDIAAIINKLTGE